MVKKFFGLLITILMLAALPLTQAQATLVVDGGRHYDGHYDVHYNNDHRYYNDNYYRYNNYHYPYNYNYSWNYPYSYTYPYYYNPGSSIVGYSVASSPYYYNYPCYQVYNGYNQTITCVTVRNYCGANQYWNGSYCVCANGYVMDYTSNTCVYAACGPNQYRVGAYCYCNSGYVLNPYTNTCVWNYYY